MPTQLDNTAAPYVEDVPARRSTFEFSPDTLVTDRYQILANNILPVGKALFDARAAVDRHGAFLEDQVMQREAMAMQQEMRKADALREERALALREQDAAQDAAVQRSARSFLSDFTLQGDEPDYYRRLGEKVANNPEALFNPAVQSVLARNQQNAFNLRQDERYDAKEREKQDELFWSLQEEDRLRVHQLTSEGQGRAAALAQVMGEAGRRLSEKQQATLESGIFRDSMGNLGMPAAEVQRYRNLTDQQHDVRTLKLEGQLVKEGISADKLAELKADGSTLTGDYDVLADSLGIGRKIKEVGEDNREVERDNPLLPAFREWMAHQRARAAKRQSGFSAGKAQDAAAPVRTQGYPTTRSPASSPAASPAPATDPRFEVSG